MLDLSSNNIDEVPEGRFNGHNTLRFINLNYNTIGKLIGKPFKGAENVVELHLANNLISTIHDNVFNDTKQLKVLNLFSNQLKEICEHTFTGLRALEVLDISSNKLLESISKRAFVGMHNLIEIRMNRLPEIRTYVEALKECVNLRVLEMDGHENEELGEGFRSLRKLHTLILSEPKGDCELGVVSDGMFVNVPFLKVLNISFCKINVIERNALSPMRNLLLLNISNNMDGLKFISNISHGLMHTGIKVLIMDSMEHSYGVGHKLSKDQFNFTRNLTIEVLSFRSNRLEYIDKDTLPLMPRNLKVLDVSDNRFSVGFYLLQSSTLANLEVICADYLHTIHISLKTELKLESCVMKYAQKYIEEDTEGKDQNTTGDIIEHYKMTPSLFQQPEGSEVYSLSSLSHHNTLGSHVESIPRSLTFNIDTAYFPPKVTEVYARYSHFNLKIQHVIIQPENNIQKLLLNGNILHSWNSSLQHLGKLGQLDLSENYCSVVSNDFFASMTNLEKLNIGANFLGDDLSKDSNGLIFRNLQRLKHLDIRSNKIRFLPKKIFKGLVSLQILNLADNDISSLEIDLRPLQFLSQLNLQQNFISSISRKIGDQLDALAIKTGLSVDLRRNNLGCGCSDLHFIHWVLHTKVLFTSMGEYSCLESDQKLLSLKNLSTVYEQLNVQCRNYTGVIVGCSICLSVFTAIVAFGIIYRQRWKLRYIYYMSVGRYKLVQQDQNLAFDYDAFVSFADEDEDFVNHKMIPELEEQYGVRLCIHHRDFDFGHLIAENIVESIRKSKRTVFVLSHAFLSSYWCRFEFNMARMEGMYKLGGQCIIYIIVLESFSPRDLNLELLDVMESKSYIEYPNDEQGNEIFWDKIQRVLKA